jgi:long-chain acyl-CoA synthetase
MTDRPWLSSYPQGVPADIDASHYPSLVALMEESFKKYADRTAYSFMGKDISYGETDRQSKAFAAYLQGLGLVKGDRVAAMMPNCPQYPIAVAAILRAGLILVNVNPLYTPRELEHQLKDSGAKAIVIMENFGTTLQQCIAATPIKHIVLASMGDRLGFLKGALVNYVVRNVKKLVPQFSLPGTVRFNDALDKGASGSVKPVAIGPDDVAVLQYTGGTTGVSKGAVLLHRNVIANVLQSEAWNEPAMKKVPANEQPTSVCALPLYHIFAFTVGMMLNMRTGGKLILIPNPRDLAGVLKELSKHTIHSFPAVNTLFNGLANHADFNTVNWKNLKISVGGGMAVQAAVAKLWLEKTGCSICEGYGLSETSPSTTCNPTDSTAYTGTIGLPLPSTWLKLLDDEGNEVPLGERGEIAIKGPQVMAGYWQRPDETAKVMTPDGYFKSGDIGVVDDKRLLQGGRPQEGHDPGVGLQRVPERDRGRGRAHSGRARMRRGRRARREDRRGREARHRQERPVAHRGAGARILQSKPYGLQAAANRGVSYRHAEDTRRQDPSPRAARHQEVAAE